MNNEESTYKSAGVDIEAGELAVHQMKDYVYSTYNDNVLTNLGTFGGMFKFPSDGYEDPVIVSSIDGVGTKVKVASMMNRFDTIGIDLVNHCINDILVQGAKPLLFMDYFAASKLDPQMVTEVVKGISEACCAAGCVLIGGETAEMPGVYCEGEFDLAGSIVGIVDRKSIIDGSKVKHGDAIIGIASSGLHTNGYSLARKVLFDDCGYQADQYTPELGNVLGDVLLTPHKCYLNSIHKIMECIDIHAMAHITGGGFYSNIPRVLPADCQVLIERRSWPVPPIFTFLQEKGNIDSLEMHRAFNMGIGMIIIVENSNALNTVNILEESGENAWIIGEVKPGGREVTII
ncbi:MAG: phosphoribosylformylglycinamidine cyclo-ligase [Armatimonadota bacterium]